MTLPSVVWKRLRELYEPLNAATQFDHLSSIWNISLDDYSSITDYCSALEVATSNFSASGASEFAWFDSHVLALIALMGLPTSYKVTQHNILSKAGSSRLMLNAIKANLLNEQRLLTRESKSADKSNAFQAQKSNEGTN